MWHCQFTVLRNVAERSVETFNNHQVHEFQFRVSKVFQIGSKIYHFDRYVPKPEYSVIDTVEGSLIEFVKMMNDTDRKIWTQWRLYSEFVTSRNSIFVYGHKHLKYVDSKCANLGSGHFAEFPIHKQQLGTPIYWDSPISIRATVMMDTTKGGRYLIMIGVSGWGRKTRCRDDLFVFDLKSKMLKLQREMKHVYDGGLMMNNDPIRDELLAFGFVRGIFGKRKFESIPNCLIKLIGESYCNECIYLVKNRSNELEEMIKVDDIMNNALHSAQSQAV